MVSDLSGTLEKDVQKGIETLRTLTKVQGNALVGKSQELPTEELAKSTAIAFFHTTKAGLIASVVTGHGFLIKKVHCQ
jgi:hypothetical protein